VGSHASVIPRSVKKEEEEENKIAALWVVVVVVVCFEHESREQESCK
jgi:hypothetical protein